MSDAVKTSVTPAFPRRMERARATRRRILHSAMGLFGERGYVATTIDAIASDADVAPETIYAAFGNKRTILAELVDLSIAGDDDATPILERDWVRRMREDPDPTARLRLLTAQGSAILQRRSAVDAVVRGAAASDPEIAVLHDVGKAQRLASQRSLLRMVLAGAQLREGMTLAVATDVLYAIGSPETYQLLVVDRGWSHRRFARWYGETMERLLFGETG